MSADTILIKYIFLIFPIFSKLVKSEPYLAILLFYDVNLTATVGKCPIFFSILFYQNYFPSSYLCRAVRPVMLSHRKIWYRLMYIHSPIWIKCTMYVKIMKLLHMYNFDKLAILTPPPTPNWYYFFLSSLSVIVFLFRLSRLDSFVLFKLKNCFIRDSFHKQNIIAVRKTSLVRIL